MEYLSESSLFITHAGFNSMYEGFYTSVPMLMLPHIPEQKFNAQKIEQLKVGYCMEEDKISEAYLNSLMHKVNKNWFALKQSAQQVSCTFFNSNDNDSVARKIISLSNGMP